jgi:nucleotide-binding universal stress UspA family protein
MFTHILLPTDGSGLSNVAIQKVAGKRGCDLILMASHGRRGLKGLLLGSETQKVLTHSLIPVLVHRERAGST